ncbi:MAG: Smr/MutS family protein [Deltaproteobacteria bacterium]|nr:Smr/MutS family protein [Deltaproteobacteria bacterium]
MARRKKRKKRSGEQKILKKKPGIFNPLKGDASSLKKAEKAAEEEPDVQIQPEHRQKEDENLYFLEALADVKPLSGSKNKITRLPDPNIKPAHPAGNDELDALAHLSDLVSGHGEIDISFTDEYIEGSVTGFSQKLMQQLKKGKFPVQDYVDLHGLTKQDAEARVRDFLIQSYRLGLRCVLIVHGRGLNSEDHIPVLKERLPLWLNRGPINKIVLAFSTARPYDGGAGAVYVLLKRLKA